MCFLYVFVCLCVFFCVFLCVLVCSCVFLCVSVCFCVFLCVFYVFFVCFCVILCEFVCFCVFLCVFVSGEGRGAGKKRVRHSGAPPPLPPPRGLGGAARGGVRIIGGSQIEKCSKYTKNTQKAARRLLARRSRPK